MPALLRYLVDSIGDLGLFYRSVPVGKHPMPAYRLAPPLRMLLRRGLPPSYLRSGPGRQRHVCAGTRARAGGPRRRHAGGEHRRAQPTRACSCWMRSSRRRDRSFQLGRRPAGFPRLLLPSALSLLVSLLAWLHSLTSSPPSLGHEVPLTRGCSCIPASLQCHSRVVTVPFTRGEHRSSQVACGPHAHNIAHLLAEMQAHDPRAILRVRLHSLPSRPFPPRIPAYEPVLRRSPLRWHTPGVVLSSQPPRFLFGRAADVTFLV